MNILFMSIGNLSNLDAPGIYTDLLRTFRQEGHNLHVACIRERREGGKTTLSMESGTNVLRIRNGNIKKCNIVEKAISALLIEPLFIRAIQKFYSNVRFDLVLYSTPPITFVRAVEYIKRRDGARSYLLLKDIFPQNAVDLGMMSENSFIHRFFRRKEKSLYAISDHIGCMSVGNMQYLLNHNPEVHREKVEVCPNSVSITAPSNIDKVAARKKYGIPQDKTVFVYGGNLGKPQGIAFLIECLIGQVGNDKSFFLIIGSGTEEKKIEEYIQTWKPPNVKLLPYAPKDEYDKIVSACDVGLIFLDHRFTIPNYPSRLLSYLQARLPVLACTDCSTDVGQSILQGNIGWWCESNNEATFRALVNVICHEDLSEYTNNTETYMRNFCDVKDSYRAIVSKMEDLK